MVILPVNEEDIDGLVFKDFGAFDPGEAAAEDHDSWIFHEKVWVREKRNTEGGPAMPAGAMGAMGWGSVKIDPTTRPSLSVRLPPGSESVR